MDYMEQIEKSSRLLTSKEQMLGKGLNIPNNATNSGSRKIMNGTHQSHSLVLSHGEVPYIGTGYENRFGEMSSSLIKAEDDMEVIAKIPKFSYIPNHHYYLILKNLRTNEISIAERISYKYVTESYGYLYNNSIIDMNSNPGNVIKKGTTLRISTGFDEYGNKTNGRNINIAYLALDQNMEDSVVISSRCTELLSAPLIRSVKIIINENDIPLNLYGNDDIYKVFPDIGETIKDGILMGYRREKREEAIYTQSVRRLQELMMSDDKITINGTIIDINIYCNNPEYIQKSKYNQQFLLYYNDRLRVDQAIIDSVGPFITQNFPISYELNKAFSIAKSELSGKKYIDKKQFSNITIEFTVMENRKLGVGDKVADRYGGKGVVSEIIPDHLMPKFPNGDIVDMIKNSSTMYNRENAGQIFELEVNYISMRILDYIRENNLLPRQGMELILKFVSLQSPVEYEYMKKYISTLSEEEYNMFFMSIMSKTCIMISNEPMSETMTIDDLSKLYDEFPWIVPTPIKIPIIDSNGEYRFIDSRRPLIVAPQYCIRLKQFAEEKFSATSLSSTNLRGENTKSKASKNYREPNSNTPIKFGQMESGDLAHMGTEAVVINLMLHSLSPHGRRLVEQIAIGDPYNVDVKLDTKSKNRSAEILNTRLKTMGYRIIFSKKRKKKLSAVITNAITFEQNSFVDPKPAIKFLSTESDLDKYYDLIKDLEEFARTHPDAKSAIRFTEDFDYKKGYEDIM